MDSSTPGFPVLLHLPELAQTHVKRIATVISITIIVPNRLASGVRCKTSSVVSVAQLYPTLCSPMDCSLPGPSVHGILQARILKCVANSFSRRSPWPRDWTQVSCILGRFFTIWASGEAWCKTRWDTNIEKKMTLCRSKKGPTNWTWHLSRKK